MSRPLALLLFLCLLPTAATAQVDRKKIADLIETARKHFDVPGVAVVVVRDDRPIYLGGHGVRQLGTSEPVTPDTLFAIASNTKAFTATAVAMLVAEGKMKWDDPVRTHIPTFRLSDPLADRDVTIRDLLCHRTGLARHDPLRYRAAWGPEEIVRRMGFLKPATSLRSHYEYNNLAFLAAGQAVALVEQQPFSEVLRQRLFVPLGMKDVSISGTDMEKLPNRATPHLPSDDGKTEVIPRYLQVLDGAGGLNASAAALTNWLRFQLNDGVLDGKRLLPAAALKETHTAQMTIRLDALNRAQYPEDVTNHRAYGLGWNIYDHRGQLVIAHAGAIDGFRSRVVLFPKARLGIAILSNRGGHSLPEALGLTLGEYLLGLPTRDWNVHFLAATKQDKAREDAKKQARLAKRRPGTKPSLDLSAYAGIYTDAAYGEARVVLVGDRLSLRFATFALALEHFHLDTFTATHKQPQMEEEVVFRLGGDGKVASVQFLGQEFSRSGDVQAAASWPRDALNVETRLGADLNTLAGEDAEGRGIRTKGIDRAAEHIARELARAGLKPGSAGTYFQPFHLTASAAPPRKSRLILSGPLGQQIALVQSEHFQALPLSGKGKVEGQLVFAGHGIVAPERNHDDYAGLDVSGKIVLLLTDAPRRDNPFVDVFGPIVAPHDGPHSLRAKIRHALDRKAAGVLVVASAFRNRHFLDVLPGRADRPTLDEPFHLPVAQVRRAALDDLFRSAMGKNLADAEKDIDRTMKSHGGPLTGWRCRLETEVEHTRIPVRNVVGVLEGSGPLANETIVIGAHYDHVGMGGGSLQTGYAGPTAPGGVGHPNVENTRTALHPGADDNASGTTALLELARRFGAIKEREGRRLVFIAFSAEESGLLGSEYYCRRPLYPLATTAAMLNMDMVGRLQESKLNVRGTGTGRGFTALLEQLNSKQVERFDLHFSPTGRGASDYASFFPRGVPVLSFQTGFHEQYHRPGDRVELINVAGLRRIVDLVENLAQGWTLGERPDYVATEAVFDRGTAHWTSVPAIGVAPNYRDRQRGVLVERVVADTPAARAGIKQNDRIIAVGGKEVADAPGFAALTRTLLPGQKVAVSLLREGKPQSVTLALAVLPRAATFGIVADLADDLGGLLIGAVKEKSPAATAGLRVGDRVVSVAGRPIRSLRELGPALAAGQPGATVEVIALRGGETVRLTAFLP